VLQVRSTPSRLGPVYSRRVLCRNLAALCVGHAMFSLALLPLLALQSSVTAWWATSASVSSVSPAHVADKTATGTRFTGFTDASVPPTPSSTPALDSAHPLLQLEDSDNGSLLFAVLFGVAAASSIVSTLPCSLILSY